MISLKPKYLKRYKDIIGLLLKYGRRDLVTQSRLQEQLIDTDVDWADVDESDSPEDLARDLERLGPSYIKLGQVLSTRSDLLPQPYLDALSRLQDDVRPLPWEEVESVITRELGVKISQAFGSFDHEPLAAASLGQVHLATLRSGREVAVKIQRPNIREVISDDLEAFGEIARFLDANTEIGRRYQFSKIVKSLQRSLVSELDYQREAENCKVIRDNLTDFGLLIVPETIPDYTTSSVLTMEYIRGTKITDLSPVVLMELDRETLADELFRAYLHQVLIDGIFHADPHPGNLILTPDHRIALLDLGMVARIGSSIQESLIKLLLDISDGHGDEAARVALEMGETTRYTNERKFRQEISHLVAESYTAKVEQIKAGRIIMQIQRIAAENGIHIPDDLVMLGKTLLNLDRVVTTLHPEFDPNKAMRRAASQIIRNRLRNRLTLGSVYHSLLEANAFLQLLPERLNKFSRLISENQFRVHVDAIDENKLIDGLQKIANRITTGLVVAALIIGASLIMRIDTEHTIMGYPALAMIFFTVAFIAGIYVIVKSVASDIRVRRRNNES